MSNFEILKFDSELFGCGVAKIIVPRLDFHDLREVLSELKKLNVQLVYWASDSLDKNSQKAAQELNGSLCSEQVTYLIDLSKAEPFTSDAKEYTATIVTPELETLALAAGKYSRFVCDPKFPHAFFVKLYQNWIVNSVNKTIARKVLVVEWQQKIVGMITLGEKNKRGDIGLVGIAEGFRGQGFGQQLVRAAQQDFIAQGYGFAQVVTQHANVPACKLYEKCGFRVEKIENYYHFWL